MSATIHRLRPVPCVGDKVRLISFPGRQGQIGFVEKVTVAGPLSVRSCVDGVSLPVDASRVVPVSDPVIASQTR